jgi:hypothetical protein
MARRAREAAAEVLQVTQDESMGAVGTEAVEAPQDAPQALQTPASMLDGAQRGPDPNAPEPPVRRWRVDYPARVALGGCVVDLKVGKIVDERAYDVPRLRSAGVQLTEV